MKTSGKILRFLYSYEKEQLIRERMVLLVGEDWENRTKNQVEKT